MLMLWGLPNIAGLIAKNDTSLNQLAESLSMPTQQEDLTPKKDLRAEQLAAKIHEFINQERIKHHLNPLVLNTILNKAAQNHSTDMATRNYFNHLSPEGHDFVWRYKQVGFTGQIIIGNMHYFGAENIALNTITMDAITTTSDWQGNIIKIEHTPQPQSIEKVAQNIVAGWMKSPGHKKNILTPYWQREGIGVAFSFDKNSRVELAYVTQNFC